MMAKLADASLQQIESTPELLDFARALGGRAFADNCAPCHGSGGGGAKGYPNLNDNDWLWGGTLADIQQTITHGVRSGDDQGHQGSMPAFGRDGMLKHDDIVTVANYVRSLSGLSTAPGTDLARRRQNLRRQLRRLSRAARQGQPLARRAQSDRSDLALRLEHRHHHRRHLERPRRRHAGLGRQARSGDDQGACGLRPYVRRRGVTNVPRLFIGDRWRTLRCSRNSLRSCRLVDEATLAAAGAAAAELQFPEENPDDEPLYAARKKIYPQHVSGTFRRIKWAVLIVTLGIYYFLPFVRWDRGPNAPGQAVLIDLPGRRFYFFFIEIWPQEVYYLTGLLIHRGDGAVPDERARRPGVVRLSVSADGVDRPVRHCRALDRGRPARTPAARPAAVDFRARCAHGFEAFLVADDRLVDRRRLGAVFRRRADAGEESGDVPGAARRLCLYRHADFYDLRAGRLDARTGLRLYVPVAAHPGGVDRRIRAQRHLSLRPRRAARLAEEGGGAARAWPAGRRLHRLSAMRPCLPDRRGYPPRPQSRLHSMRAVHRRLRRGDGEDRPADAADRV